MKEKQFGQGGRAFGKPWCWQSFPHSLREDMCLVIERPRYEDKIINREIERGLGAARRMYNASERIVCCGMREKGACPPFLEFAHFLVPMAIFPFVMPLNMLSLTTSFG